MSWNSFCSIIDPCCFKHAYTHEEYTKVKSLCPKVNATDIYKVYQLYDDMPYQEFYQKLRQVLYFDKYECIHGTEFMYYIKFKELTLEERLPSDVIKIYKAR